MNKSFYIVNLDCSKSYKTLCDLVNYSAFNQVHWVHPDFAFKENPHLIFRWRSI